MIKVPLSSVNVNTLPSGYMTASADQNSFGAPQGAAMQNLGQGMSSAGSDAFKVALQEKQKYEFVQAQDALVKAHAELNEYVNTDILTRQGLNARDAEKDVSDKAKSIYDTHMKNLSGGSRAYFDISFKSATASQYDRAQRYGQDQFKRASLETNQAVLRQNVEDAVNDYNNTETLAKSRNAIYGTIAAEKAMMGYSPEVAKQKAADAISGMHAGILDRMLVNNDLGKASEYYRANGAEINPQLKTQIEAKLKSASDLELSQSVADNLMLKYPSDWDTAVAEVRKTYSGTQEEQIIAQLKTRYQEKENFRQKSERDNLQALILKQYNGKLTIPDIDNAVNSKMISPDIGLKYKDALMNPKIEPKFIPELYTNLRQSFAEYQSGKISENEFLKIYANASVVLPERYTKDIWFDYEDVKQPAEKSLLKNPVFSDQIKALETMEKNGAFLPAIDYRWNNTRVDGGSMAKEDMQKDSLDNMLRIKTALWEYMKQNPKATTDDISKYRNGLTSKVIKGWSVEKFNNVYDSSRTANTIPLDSGTEIERVSNGRIAIFNSETKAFIRWK